MLSKRQEDLEIAAVGSVPSAGESKERTEFSHDDDPQQTRAKDEGPSHKTEEEEEFSPTKWLNEVFMESIRLGASDIHIIPEKEYTSVRFRVGGVITEVARWDIDYHDMVLSRIKIISGLQVVEKNIPQDGHLELAFEVSKADIAAGKKPGVTCKLPANADLKLVAAKVLAAAGRACTVKGYRWVGLSDADHVEVDEAACDNGQGFMMIVALPGATYPVHVDTCNQSAKRGLPCKLSDNGDIGPTLQSFRDTLAKNKIACDATDQTTRVIGQIVAKKQHVIEFACPQRPKGLVAYIPQEGSTAPFEVMDCPGAAKRGVVCALPGNKGK